MGVYQSQKPTEIMDAVLSARGVQLDGRTFHTYDEKGKPFWIPSYCSAGDYCGNLVEASNVKALEEMLSEIETEKGITIYFLLHEAYDTRSLCLYPRAFAFPEIVEALNGLSDYPLLDDSLHCEMELEAQAESWDSWAREDFKRELCKLMPDGFGAPIQDESQTLADLPSLNPLDFPGNGWDGSSLPWEPSLEGPDSDEIIDLLTEEEVDTLSRQAMESGSGSHYPINGSGDSFHFYTEEMAKSLSWEEDILPLIKAKIGSILPV